MPAAPLGRRRPRPVADVPSLDGRELARAWLVEMVAAAPLERATGLPGPGFTNQAPRLCGAVVAALGGEAAFDDLEPGGALAPLAADAATFAGAEAAGDAVAALEALRAVTWAALVDALHRPPPSLLADLADRLGATIATVATAALDTGTPTMPPGGRGPLATVLRPDDATSPPADPPPGAARVQDAGDLRARAAPWTAAIDTRIERHREDRLPFAVLCLEVADLDRLVASERDGEVALALEAAEVAVAAQLRPADVLVRERPGRYWLIAPDTDLAGGRSLAHLLAAALAGVPGHRGAPLEAAIGLAACPQDGAEAAALEGRAEEGLFAARAAGVRVAGPLRG